MNFIELKNYIINLDHIVFVEKSGDKLTVTTNTGQGVYLDAEDSQLLLERLRSGANTEMPKDVPGASIS